MESKITLTPNDALAPLALFGMLLVGDRAIAVSSISVVEMIEKQIRIELTNGRIIDCDSIESDTFIDQLQSIFRQAQFGGGVPQIKRG